MMILFALRELLVSRLVKVSCRDWNLNIVTCCLVFLKQNVLSIEP